MWGQCFGKCVMPEAASAGVKPGGKAKRAGQVRQDRWAWWVWSHGDNAYFSHHHSEGQLGLCIRAEVKAALRTSMTKAANNLMSIGFFENKQKQHSMRRYLGKFDEETRIGADL
ncbi:hypothetical protein H920_03546 [Fukomys damarensis]|uniref:Uncharacterized protein n=1 Tax=Fukomys damarensis TaxID=885580 RepID=A0A091DSA2_FUKDA|nr:hypothetical protein H920_03546 [Fukomys damarensis]